MRIKFLTIALAGVLFASAQEVTITRHEQLLKGVENEVYNPVLSADGQKVLFTQSSYKGLKMYDMEDDATIKVADDWMAGFKPAFSRDGKSVYFMSQTRGDDMRIYREMKSFDFDSRATAIVAEKSRGMRGPVSVDGGLAVVSDNGKMLKAKRKGGLYVYADGAELVVVRDGEEKRLSPVETKYTYLWESLSPDGTKILFYAGAKGAYVCDLDGNVLADLGKYTSPYWMGNDYIVAENATSDGHQYESCQIMLLKADGSFSKALTKPESMSMNPTASADGSRIAYNTIDGRLFVMELTVK